MAIIWIIPCTQIASPTTGAQKKEKMQVLYENWLSADENWSKSKLVLSLQQSSKLSTFGCRKWFTRQDLIDKYKSPEIASEIIQEKLALEESVRNTVVRPHPDAPSNLLLQQFLCFDEDGESEQHDSVLSSLFQAVSKNKKKDKDKKKRKRSTSSSSESSESGSSSGSSESSSSDDKKKKKNAKKDKSGKKKGKNTKKDKKDKKETEKQKEAREKKELKEKERDEEKAKNKIRSNATKAVSLGGFLLRGRKAFYWNGQTCANKHIIFPCLGGMKPWSTESNWYHLLKNILFTFQHLYFVIIVVEKNLSETRQCCLTLLRARLWTPSTRRCRIWPRRRQKQRPCFLDAGIKIKACVITIFSLGFKKLLKKNTMVLAYMFFWVCGASEPHTSAQ